MEFSNCPDSDAPRVGVFLRFRILSLDFHTTQQKRVFGHLARRHPLDRPSSRFLSDSGNPLKLPVSGVPRADYSPLDTDAVCVGIAVVPREPVDSKLGSIARVHDFLLRTRGVQGKMATALDLSDDEREDSGWREGVAECDKDLFTVGIFLGF